MKLFILTTILVLTAGAQTPEKLRVGIAGLTHGHAAGFLRTALARPDLEIAGISEADATVVEAYLKRFPALNRKLIHQSHAAMLDRARPEAVMISPPPPSTKRSSNSPRPGASTR